MFRTRRKPGNYPDPKIEEDCASLTDAIHVNQLHKKNLPAPAEDAVASTNSLPKKELIRRKHHYENFKEAYHQRLINTEKKPNAPKQGDSGYSHGPRNTETVDQLIKRLGSGYEGDIQQLYKRPLFMKTPLKTVKTVKVEVPAHSQNAIWCPSGESDTSIKTDPKSSESIKRNKRATRETSSILKKLLDLEDEPKPEKKPLKSKQSDLMQEIQEANIQVDVASMQLQHINNLIQGRKLTPVTEEEEERDVVTPEAQSESKSKVDRKYSNKWNSKEASRGKNSSEKTKRLVNTLNTLNKRLEMMQEKMLQSRSSYKSIKDYLNPKEPKPDPLQLLFKNNNYPETKPIIKSAENTVSDMELTDILGEMMEEVTQPATECIKEVESPPKLPPPKKPQKTALGKYLAKEEEEKAKKKPALSPKQFLKKNSSSVDVFLPPNYTEENGESQFNLIDKKLKHRLVVIKENNEVDIVQPMFSKAMQESIQKSDYLRKEFNSYCKNKHGTLKKGNLHFGSIPRPTSAAKRK